jgi:hypothetical protein
MLLIYHFLKERTSPIVHITSTYSPKRPNGEKQAKQTEKALEAHMHLYYVRPKLSTPHILCGQQWLYIPNLHSRHDLHRTLHTTGL